MAKRVRSDAYVAVDIDEALRPQKVARVGPSTSAIQIDPANLMDNWLDSAKKLGEQRNSPIEKARKAWLARKALDPQKVRQVAERWYYNTEETFKYWASSLPKPPADDHLKLPAYPGGKEISWIYHWYWMKGSKDKFLEAIYSNYSFTDKPDVIPEITIWRIFRCMVSELVPASETKGRGLPDHIVGSPDTIWQVGKVMLLILTHGRFWDDQNNVLSPIDHGEKFGEFKKNVLQKQYSKSLMKHVLSCLTYLDCDRPSRSHLLDHFRDVFAIYNGTFIRPVEGDDDLPYIPEGYYQKRIPAEGLTRAEGRIYERLLKTVTERKAKYAKDGRNDTPHVVVITDLAKDYDDLMALMVLKELHRLGVVKLEGFVANLAPAHRRARFGRGALDSLGCKDIPVGVGSVGDDERNLTEFPHEFENTIGFMGARDDPLPNGVVFPEGQALLEEIFQRNIAENHKVTLLTISSLMDAAEFVSNQAHTELVRKGLANVIQQGGYRVINGILTADPLAANNKFDMPSANIFHKFLQDNKIPSTVWTKVAANHLTLSTSLFEFIDATDHPLGFYLRQVQMRQDVNFYEDTCGRPERKYAPHMDQQWFIKFKSTWPAAGHEPDEVAPLGKAMAPYFTRIVAYDALAAVGTAGDDVLEEFRIMRPLERRKDADDPLHQIVGVPKIEAAGEAELPEETNFDGEVMGLVITALMKGSVLWTKKGVDWQPVDRGMQQGDTV